MHLAAKIRYIRTTKNLSQGDLENRTGLKRCYISRVEHGHTVPSVETLEKLARGLEIPIDQFFYEGEQSAPVRLPIVERREDWASTGQTAVRQAAAWHFQR